MNNTTNAIEVTLGSGKVAIYVFNDSDGHGLIFKDTGIVHNIGDPDEETYNGLKDYAPQDGDVFIKCTNVESALVLLRQVTKVVEKFTELRK